MTTTRAARTVAVLGPRESAAGAVAEALTSAAEAAAGSVDLRVVVDAGPDDQPDTAVLVVDAVCPIRPDDVEVARGVAARVPLVVALAGRVASCTRETLSETVDVTSRRLADAGVPAPVHVLDERTPGAAAALLAAAREQPDPATAPASSGSAPPPSSSSPGQDPTSTVDWLLARRTEAITSRSQSLRQGVQALRIEVVQDLHRSLRDLGSRAREELGSARRARVDGVVRALSDDADAAVAGAIARADLRVDALVARHLGPAAPATPRIPAPTGGITPGRAPRNLGEETLVLAMGAAGGTGVGRMLLSPLAEVPGMGVALLPLALLCGLALGCTTLVVRRTQAARTHAIAVVTDRLAALRAEVEQSLGSRVLAAESTITDGFAHDPGPRVADLERRIRHLRLVRTATPASGPTATAGSRSP